MSGFDFRIGSHVHFLDGRGGVLQKLVIDSYTHRVTDLVVEKGLLQKHDRVIPISAVEAVTPSEVYVAINSEELQHYPEYRQFEFKEPVEGWEMAHYPRQRTLHWLPYGAAFETSEQDAPYVQHIAFQGVRANQTPIGRGTHVRDREGDLGRVDHLLVEEETLELTHLVVHRGITPYYRVIPISWIESIEDDIIHLRGTRDQIERLPYYRVRLAEDTLTQLQDRLHAARHDYSQVTASMEHNTLCLRGVVQTEHAKHEAEEIGRSIPGVIDVENRLQIHASLATRVTEALEADPRTAGAIIEVIVDQGVVTLKGEVASNEIHMAAEEIAERQEGVLSVVNALEVVQPVILRATSPEATAVAWQTTNQA